MGNLLSKCKKAGGRVRSAANKVRAGGLRRRIAKEQEGVRECEIEGVAGGVRRRQGALKGWG